MQLSVVLLLGLALTIVSSKSYHNGEMKAMTRILNELQISRRTGSSGWSYSDPAIWSLAYPNCAGHKQSPINVKTGIARDLYQDEEFEGFNLDSFYDIPSGDFTAINNGHTAQISLPSGAYTTTGGGLDGTYNALQFHFHWGADDASGSEHAVDGGRFPLEMHIVHTKEGYSIGGTPDALAVSDGLAVLGVFFELSDDDNEDLAPLIDALETLKDSEVGASISVPAFDVSVLIPENFEDLYRYQGSLTTPPCSEAVVWTLFKETIPISEAQLSAFRALPSHHGHIQPNFRPLQDLHGRHIYST